MNKEEFKNLQPELYGELEKTILNNAFPCLYAKSSLKKGEMLFYTFNDLEEFNKEIKNSMNNYISLIDSCQCPRSKSYKTALFIIIRNETATPTEKILRLLETTHKQDPSEWPHEKTKNMDDQDFEFYWSGRVFFPVILSPDHPSTIRKSPYFIFALQPGAVFDYNKKNRPDFYERMRKGTHKIISRTYGEEKPFYLSEKSTGKNICQYAGEDMKEHISDYIYPTLNKY